MPFSYGEHCCSLKVDCFHMSEVVEKACVSIPFSLLKHVELKEENHLKFVK